MRSESSSSAGAAVMALSLLTAGISGSGSTATAGTGWEFCSLDITDTALVTVSAKDGALQAIPNAVQRVTAAKVAAR